MGVPSMPELLIILVIVLLLFGAKKIPDLASGLGKGIKNFKKSMSDEDSTQVATNDSKIEPTKETNSNTQNSNAKPSEPKSV